MTTARNGSSSTLAASQAAGIARSHLAMIESGTKQANFETIWKIANALEIPPHEIVFLIEKEAESITIKKAE